MENTNFMELVKQQIEIQAELTATNISVPYMELNFNNVSNANYSLILDFIRSIEGVTEDIWNIRGVKKASHFFLNGKPFLTILY